MSAIKRIVLFFVLAAVIYTGYSFYMQVVPYIEEMYVPAGFEKLPENAVGQGEEIQEYDEAGPVHIENFSFFPIITINKIKSKPEYSLMDMEKNIFALINRERALQGLSELKWNDYVASVAREHSYNLARENEPLTEFYILCHVPIIHHEGLDFGLYHNDRLDNRGIYYFSASAENIFLDSESKGKMYQVKQPIKCEDFDSEFEYEGTEEEKIAEIRQDIQERLDYASGQEEMEWKSINWKNQSEIELEVVEGWMNSPGHRKNILGSEFDETGVGISEVNEYLLITQVFITRVSCGYKTGPCCKKPGYYPYCYVPLSCKKGICQEQ